jgi:hypothetical protein
LDTENNAHFFVLYSARHQRCGRFVERTDFRVVTLEDLFAWSADFSLNGIIQPLPLHCDACAENLEATHVRILHDAQSVARTVVPEVEIHRFHPNDWIHKLKQ